jgi:putative peptide zinc metalloprotease protein
MLTLAAGVTITEFDSASGGMYLLLTPRGRFILSRSAVQLIRSLDGRASVAELGSSDSEVERLEQIFRDHILPTGAFGDSEAAEEPKRGSRPPSAYVHAARELLAAPAVGRLARPLRHLYRGSVAVPLLAAVLAAQAAFFSRGHAFRLQDIPAEAFFAGTLLFLATLPLHELGHAAACERFGCRPGAMGFGFYLVFPCFFTDVSNAWRLPRWQRVVVDLAGMHVQLLCTAVFALMFLWTGHAAWTAALLMVDGSIVLNLKPYLRRDGYWILVDIVGVPAPGQAARDYIRYALLPRKRTAMKPLLLGVSPGLRAFTVAYISAIGAVSTGVVLAVLWKTATVILPGYPAVLAALVRDPLASGRWFHDALVALVQTSVIAGVALFLWSRAQQGLHLVWRDRAAGASAVATRGQHSSAMAGGR